jgi:2,3-bisphosphoglycerate-dependent phosphoglycerate mutase
MTTVYLARHGESEANVRKVFSNKWGGGSTDLPLTILGRRQADQGARWLAGRGATHIYAAPLLRAQQTAAIFKEALNLPVTILEDLDEVRVGDLDGRADPKAWEIFDAIFDRWYAGDKSAGFPGGETFGQALERYQEALREIALRHPSGTAIAVTHGGIQLTVLPRICPTMDSSARSLPNVAISQIEVTPDGFACHLWGSTAHLAD